MIRLIKKLLCLGLVLSSTTLANAYSLIGPYEDWQVTGIGYNLPGDIGAPKALYEGYRWNLPVITYAFDQSFLLYFGTNGIAAVEQAIKVFNDLPAFSTITNDGTRLYMNGNPIPTDTRMRNSEAEVLGLVDLKSWALSMMLEQLGLASPERFAWTLRNRNTETLNGYTWTNYYVIQLNFDPVTHMPDEHVNGVRYGYEIQSYDVPLAFEDAYELKADDLDMFGNSSVAGYDINMVFPGKFFSTLTQDDVGGLAWLYNRDRLCVENLLTNTLPGKPLSGGSPWQVYFYSTNFITGATNLSTNLLVRTALRPGINKLQFKRADYDSMLGQFFTPYTNYYTDTYVSNNTFVVQPVQRVISQPDIVFTVDDLGITPVDGEPVVARRTDTSNWQNNDALNGVDGAVDGGPGVIQPPVLFSFSNRLPYFINQTDYFVNGGGGSSGLGSSRTASTSMIWGSFDLSTNAPIIYPAYGNFTVQDLRNYTVQGGRP